MQAEAAKAGHPLRAGRVLAQPLDFAPGNAAVGGLEQGRRLHSGVQGVGFAGPPRLDVPQAVNRWAVMLGILRLVGKAGLGLGLLPGGAQVPAELHLRAKPHTVGGGEQLALAPPVVNQVEDIAAGGDDVG